MAEAGGKPLGEPKSLQGSTVWYVEVSTSLTSNLGVYPNPLTPMPGASRAVALSPSAPSEPVTLVLGSGKTTRVLSLQLRGGSSSFTVPSQPCPPPAQPSLHSIPSAETRVASVPVWI